MNNEIEAKYLDIDKTDIRKKLKASGAQLLQAEVKMRRTIFDTGPNTYARVRDEGDKIVMTYKNYIDDNSILGCKEINLTVNDYDGAVKFLKACGLEMKANQETLRETWTLDNVDITIDTWPWIPTYIEIEGNTEEEVWAVADKLGFKKEDAEFGAVDKIYQHYYGIDMDIINLYTPIINFEMEPPEWAKKRIC